MNDEHPPLPWLDESSNTSSDVRAVLESAKSDGLSAAQVDALAKKVLALSAGAAAASSIAPAASSSLATKVTAAAIAIAITSVSAWVVRSRLARDERPAPRAEQPALVRSAPVERRPSVGPSTVDTHTNSSLSAVVTRGDARPASATRSDAPRTTRAVAITARIDAGSAAEIAANPADDVGLLHRAVAALRSGATSEATALLEQHRRAFAHSALSEERERIAIEALVRGGQRDEAQRAAERFRQRFAGSAQQPRIDALVRRESDR
ncbi:MAG: hypothetical protein U0269_23865 [Polyangiales bacterium]